MNSQRPASPATVQSGEPPQRAVFAERLGWLLAIFIVGAIGFLWARTQTADLRAQVQKLEAANRSLQQQLSRYETPEHFDIEANERGALRAMRAIQTALVVSVAESANGFPAALKDIGPEGKSLLDAELAAGRSSGYSITYQTGLAEPGGQITTYTISARPTQYEKTGRRSFFADEGGLVRVTSEPRAATKADPTL
jgi:hypothetical protein